MSEATRERHAFLEPFAALERELAGRGPEWLRRARREGLARFERDGFPTTREEDWRTTNLAPLARIRFRPAAPAAEAALPDGTGLDEGAPRLVFLDGRHAPALAVKQALPEGVWLGSLAEALETIPERLEQHLDARRAEGGSTLQALNAALAEDGAVLFVPDGTEVGPPIHLAYCATGSAEPTASHPRTLIVAGASSRVQVVESYQSLDAGVYLTNAVTDVVVGRNADVRHVRVQLESKQAYHISAVRSRQAEDSRFRGMNVNLGGRLVRHDVSALLAGTGGWCGLDGLYVTRDEQHVDNHTTIDHAEPHCGSREVYKGVLSDSSRANFRGRIIVRPGAQQTDAVQSNPNLVLSADALAQTRPQLEIYADDVKCTHGATVGRLDKEAIFYLRSRAIAEDDARNLLIKAFADEVLDRIEIEPLRLRLKEAVARRLPARKG